MSRDEITIQLGVLDDTQSVYATEITKQAVTQANGIALKDAAGAKYQSIEIVVENTTVDGSSAAAASEVTLKAGNGFTQNALLGDLVLAVKAGKTHAFRVADYARFLNADGSINIDFKSGFTGNIYVTGQRAGIATAETQA